MLTVLIVDDEHKICSLIQRLINWESLQLKEIGIASNGKDALEIMEKENPDIIITDVRMPVMSGLDLIAQSISMGWKGKFIVMSGYAQFEYAYTAIKHGVEDFLLKPLDKEELNHALERISGQMRSKDNKQTENTRSMFASSLLSGSLSAQQLTVEDCNTTYNTTFQEGCFLACILSFDYEKTNGASLSNLETRICKRFLALLEPLCHEILQNLQNRRMIALLNYEQDNEATLLATLGQMFTEARNFISMYPFARITLSTGTVEHALDRLAESLNAAVQLSNARIVLGTDQWHDFKDAGFTLEPLKRIPIPLIQEALPKKLEILDFGAATNIILEEWRKKIPDFKLYPYDTISWSCSYALGVLAAVQSRFSSVKDLDAYHDSIPKTILDSSSLDEIEYHLNTCFTQLFAHLEQQVHRDNNQIISLVREYITEHLREQIVLEDVASQIYLSPAYLGTLFRQKSGQTFTQFVSDVRMEQAKKLLQDHKYSIKEVSALTGFKDPRYFRLAFKRTVGIKPSEYRKIASFYAV